MTALSQLKITGVPLRMRRRSRTDLGSAPVGRAVEVVHAAPVGGFSFTSCCDRTVQELPRYDRISRFPDQVTCGRLSEIDELLLSGAPMPGRRQNTEQLLYEMALSVRSMRGPRFSLEQALQCVQSAAAELAPARHPDEHWPASLLVRITERAGQLAG
jgi:hypothetical protein